MVAILANITNDRKGSMEASALILAAGAGTRMKSSKPKVAHKILEKPLIRWVVDAAHGAGIESVVTVVGHGRELVEPLVEDTQVVVQEEQLGTAHAVKTAREVLAQTPGPLVVLTGDSPLIRPETITALVEAQQASQAAVVVLSMEMEDPSGYGRIVRDAQGGVCAIVEHKDCTPEQVTICECNSGFYCFDAPALFDALSRVSNDNAQGEYYLTDVLEICRNDGREVLALQTADAEEAMGVNSRVQLAQATRAMQHRINNRHMMAGVTMWDPESTFIGPDVEIAQDVELWPQTYLLGATKVGSHSIIGPNTRLTDTQVGSGARVDETVAIEARIDDAAECGPRAYLRPGTHLCEGAKAGTHVEIKKSTIGKGSKVPHLSYIGDTTMGENVNIGAGSITCNYDGVNKNHTEIGDNVFVGSDTMMVAPVNIGAGAIIGASSCITRDVAPDALALERADQREIEGWAAKHMAKLKAKKEAAK